MHRSPLFDTHVALGARMVPFSGWEMPLQYEGVIAEHNAVRGDAGVFDVSHLGKLRVRGPRAGEALQRALTADVVDLPAGRARYSLVLAQDGGCIDDVFAYRIREEEWLIVPNAANVEAVAQAIRDEGPEPVDERDAWAILALQGPRSYEVFEAAFPGTGATALKLHRWETLDVFGEPGIVARTGYTGEKGFEIYAPAATAAKAFDGLLRSGAEPVGLGARDTLRLEMGYALYGHELTRDVDPLEAGLGWTLAWDTPFVGRDALMAIRDEGPRRASFGIVCREKGVPRQGYAVVADDTEIGTVTSGNHSPTLGTGIALALGPSAQKPEPGRSVTIVGQRRAIAGDIVEPPFVEKK